MKKAKESTLWIVYGSILCIMLIVLASCGLV